MTSYRQSMNQTLDLMYLMREVKILERELTDKELKRREEIAKDLPDDEFKDRYGKDWMSVKMATATKMAKAEELEMDDDEEDDEDEKRERLKEKAGVSLAKKAKASGIPAGILRQVYNRGVAAWRTGHRPGTNPQQWGNARVNSFISKSKGTWGGADKDLAAKARGKKEEVELGESVVDKVKQVASKKQAMKIDGVMVDTFTASAISQIYDKVSDANKKKMDKLPITKLANLAMKMMQKNEFIPEGVELGEGKMADMLKFDKKGMSSKDIAKKLGMDEREVKAILSQPDSVKRAMLKLDEGKMSQIDQMRKDGKSAEEIAKAMKMKVKDIKKIMGEEVELGENFRVLARKGMGAESSKQAKFGQEVDYYEPKRGDKRSGKITKVSGFGYEVTDEKTGKKFRFKFYDPKKAKQLMQSEEVELGEDGHADVASAIRQCKTVMEDAQQIMAKLQTMSPEDSLPTWWTNKFAVASNSMNKMRDYIVNPLGEALDKEDEPAVKKIIGKLKGASKAHAGQAKDLEKAIKEQPEHEITVGGYTTKFFYMCGSAQTIMKKNANVEGAEEITKLQDDFYKLEKDVMDAGSATDGQKILARAIYNKIMKLAGEAGLADDIDDYMKMHLDSIEKGDPKPGFGRTDIKEDAVQTAKDRITKEKETDKKKHDKMMDRARIQQARQKNMETEEVDRKTVSSMMEQSARADARRAMRRDPEMKQKRFSKDMSATDDDKKAASKNIMVQMRKAQSLKGKFEVEFADGKKVRIPEKVAVAVQQKFNAMRKPADKEKFQAKVAKSYKDMLRALKEGFASDAQRRAAFAQGYKAKGKKNKKESVLDRIDSKLKEIKNG